MSEPFLGEIRMFAGNFAPRGWAFCDGELLAVAQNDALFSILGTIYGGDGRTTFGLPDLRGRIAIHAGKGPGLTERKLGSRFGDENVTLTKAQMPSHTHQMRGSEQMSLFSSGENRIVGNPTSVDLFETLEEDNFTMAPNAITDVGGGGKHSNLQPFLCINFILALFGIYPSRK